MFRFLFKRIHPSLDLIRSKTIITTNYSDKCEKIRSLASTVGQNRFICTTSPVFRKPNPEEEVITNKKEKPKRKSRQTVWGCIDVYRFITLEELSSVMGKPVEDLQEAALYCNIDNIDPKAKIESFDVLKQIISKFGYKMRQVPAPNTAKLIEKDKDVYPRPPAPIENLKPRPPVITVMGHVDHGKTTLLDTLRGASVAENEAGGITQHIGAFIVELDNGERVTFLDTPGHAAFSSMRARGVSCTDIIVLVVAAEDSVMPQTKEVLNLANEGQVPFVVAINKIDAPGANIEKTKRDLLSMGVNLESHGGDVMCVSISALKGINLDELVDAITTQATLMDLKSEYSGPVEGVIIESKADLYRGKLATVIVTRGTLRKGCVLVAGTAHAKVRGMFDHSNQPIELATPGTPAEILGWREIPEAGDQVLEVESEKKANAVVQYRQQMANYQKAVNDLDVIMEKRKAADTIYQERRSLKQSEKYKLDMTTKEAVDPRPKLNVIVKADVHGSVEAILDVLDTYDSSNACKLSIVHYGVGPVIENDMELAKTFNAVIYSFSLPPLKKKPNDIIIREFNIIYRLIEDVIEEINRRLPEIDVEEVVGEAEVLQLFHINEKNKKIPVIGGRCTKGQLKKNLKVKLMRDDECIYDGEILSMRHLKNEVAAVKKETECGIQLADKTIEPQIGDKVVNYTTAKQKQTIDWTPGF